MRWIKGSQTAGDEYEVHTLIGAYVIGALEPAEQIAVEHHLERCAVCAAEVTELTEVAGKLGAAVAATPPTSLRERVLTQAKQERQEPPQLPARAPSPARPAGWRRLALATAALVIVAAGSGATTYAVQQHRVTAARDQATAQQAKAKNRQEQLTNLLAASDVKVSATSLPNGGQATLVSSAQRGETGALLTDLTGLSGDRTYQLWLIRAGRMHSAGVLPTGAREAVQVMHNVETHDTMGITVEPAGGSRQPSTAPIATLPLRASGN